MSKKAAYGFSVVGLVLATTGANLATNFFTDSPTLVWGVTLAVAVLILIGATLLVARAGSSPRDEDPSISITATGPGSVAAKTINGGVSNRFNYTHGEQDENPS